MKKIIYILLITLSSTAVAQINPFYDINLKKGNAAFNKHQYSLALTYYNNALNSKGITSSQRQIIQGKIRKTNSKLRTPSATYNVNNRSSSELSKERKRLEKERQELIRLQKAELERLEEERRKLEEEKKRIQEESKEKDRIEKNRLLRMALQNRYDLVDDFHEGYARVHKNLRYGFIDEKGNEAIPLLYDFASDFSEGLASVQIGEKYGHIDHKGEIVIPLKYEFAGDFKEGLALVQINGKMGYINLKNEMIIQPIYDMGDDFKDNKVEVGLNGKYFIINKAGECIENCDLLKPVVNDSITIDKPNIEKIKLIPNLTDEIEVKEDYEELLIDSFDLVTED